MGCDIHCKTYVWSNVEEKYIDAYQLCDNLDILSREYSYGEFPELVGDRYYDLFGLFGNSARSSRPELEYLSWGMPDFLKGTTFEKYMEDSGEYGFTYITFSKFKRSLKKYKKYLSDPELFLDHDEDLYQDWKEDPNSERIKYILDEMMEENKNLISEIDNILLKLRFYDDIKNDPYGSFVYTKDRKRLIDVDKTLFMFWFDS